MENAQLGLIACKSKLFLSDYNKFSANSMEIFVSKTKIAKAVLAGLSLVCASMFPLFKSYQALFLEKHSILESAFNTLVVPLLIGAFGVFAFLMFGGMTLVLISRLFYREPQVIINSEGIEDKRLNTGLIKWNEVNAILLQEIYYSQLLILILESPEKYYRRLPKLHLFFRKMNGQKETNSLKINFTELDKPIDEAWEFIENNVIKPRAEKGIHLMP